MGPPLHQFAVHAAEPSASTGRDLDRRGLRRDDGLTWIGAGSVRSAGPLRSRLYAVHVRARQPDRRHDTNFAPDRFRTRLSGALRLRRARLSLWLALWHGRTRVWRALD